MAEQTHILRYTEGVNADLILPNQRLLVSKPLSDDNTIQLLVWNVFKQKRQDCIDVLKKHGQFSHLLLLQEAHTTPDLIDYITGYHTVADQVPALSINDNFAGVMTVANTYPNWISAFKEKEPIIRAAKSALITIYSLLNTNKTLLVANIHAVNFSIGVKVYQRQLNTLLHLVSQHDGPVILAGDFNTWSKQRIFLLDYLIKTARLKTVEFENDIRKTFLGRPLDFVFYRDLEISYSKTIDTESSDHNPLIVSFKFI